MNSAQLHYRVTVLIEHGVPVGRAIQQVMDPDPKPLPEDDSKAA